MAVKRIWFPNAPSSGIDALDRSQLAIHIPLDFVLLDEQDYFRRYLDDPVNVGTPGTPVAFDTGTEDAETLYLRRYLDDPA